MDKEINIEELKKMQNNGAIVIDVRSKQEFMENQINGAISLPEFDIAQKIARIVKDKEKYIILYCGTGTRSKKAQKELQYMGYKNVYNLREGLFYY